MPTIEERLENIELHIEVIHEHLTKQLAVAISEPNVGIDWNGGVERLRNAKKACKTCRWGEFEDGKCCGCRHDEATAETCSPPDFELWEPQENTDG